jgi:hypothetical protein
LRKIGYKTLVNILSDSNPFVTAVAGLAEEARSNAKAGTAVLVDPSALITPIHRR